ncbi:ankyrin repeat-containing domain protein [Aspergillus heterothallicus]
MTLTTLPSELIIHIARCSEFTSDIYALSLVSHRLYWIINDELYEHGAHYENGRGLERAVQLNDERAVRRLLHHSAARGIAHVEFLRILSEVAVRHASLDVVRLLRGYGMSVEASLPAERERSRIASWHLDAKILDQAVQFDRVDIVRMLLETGMDPALFRKAGVLARAGGWSGCELLDVLVGAGCDVNERDTRVGTALHHATNQGKIQNIRWLLSHGADIEAEYMAQGTPLCIAARLGMLDAVQALVEAGACPFPPLSDTNITHIALGWAAEEAHHAVARYMLESIDLESIIQNDEDRRPMLLTVAAMLGYSDIAEKVLATGHDVNKLTREFRSTRFRSVISWAAHAGHSKLVELFLQYGANVGINCDMYPMSPLALAALAGHVRIVELLLQAGAPVTGAAITIPERCNDPTVIQLLLDHGVRPTKRLLLSALSKGNIPLVQQLLDQGFKLEACGKAHNLLNCAVTGGFAAMDLLKQHRIAPDPRNLDDWEPLQRAVRAGNLEVVQYFMEKGFARNPLLRRRGTTMLSTAVLSLHGKELARMIDAITSTTENQEALTEALTEALHVATILGKEDIVPYILDKGADLRARTKQGKTALEAACESGNIRILHCLLETLYTELAGDLDDFRRCILPLEQQAPASGESSVTKAISYFYYQRRYPVC